MISKLLKPATQFVSNNTPVILTGAGVVGVVATTVLTGKATIKAGHILDEEHQKRVHHIVPSGDGTDLPRDQMFPTVQFTKEDVVKLVWREYVPVVIFAGGTIACIVMANRISAKEAAALAAAYGLTQDKFADYREKVKEQFGAGKETKVRDEVVKDQVAANPPVQGNVIITGSGDVMLLDLFSGRYFQSNIETVKKAINEINAEVLAEDSVELTRFYQLVGLPSIGISDAVGWNNSQDLVDISVHPVMMDDGKPCIGYEFTVQPIHDYSVKF